MYSASVILGGHLSDKSHSIVIQWQQFEQQLMTQKHNKEAEWLFSSTLFRKIKINTK